MKQFLMLPVLALLILGSLHSIVDAQQITAQGNVTENGQPLPSNLGAFANFGDVTIGGDPFDPLPTSGSLTASEGASLAMNSILVGGSAAGIFRAEGIGTSVSVFQDIGLIAGAFSVTDGAVVNGSSAFIPPQPFFASTFNVSGLGSHLSLGGMSLAQGTLNISDSATFFANDITMSGDGNLPTTVRINVTGGGQAVVGSLDFGFDSPRRNEIFVGDDSSLAVLSTWSIDGDNTVTLEGGTLVGTDSLNITESGELRGYGDVTSEIQLEGSPQFDHRLTVTEGQTLRTLAIRNFTGQITNFGTLDAGFSQIENSFNGHYLGENSTIRAESFLNTGTVNLIGGRNFVEANMNNQQDFNVSGGASVFFTRNVFNVGVIHTEEGSTSTFLGSLNGSGAFEGTGDVVILGEFNPGNSPGLVTFEGDLEFATSSSTEIELGGTERSTALQTSPSNRFDAFDVDGTLTLGGALEVVLLDGFQLVSGQEFMIAEVDNLRIGQFEDLDEGALVGNFAGTELFISYVAGDGNDVALFTAATPEIVLGDANQDGVVDFSDIPSFINLLVAGTFLEEADVNEDGEINFSDIPAFIDILIAN